MYTGFKVNTSINKSTVSGLNQTQLQSLQRQVDTYTRKLELEKRKYFAIQDQHKAVTQEYAKEKQRLNLLKKQHSKAESIILQTKIKNLQATLDKAVSAFDDTIAYNNKLKGEIDMLRRQKKNYIEMQRILEDQLRKVDEETTEKMELLNQKKKKAEELKHEMVQTKNKNQQERQSYINKFSALEKEYLYDRNSGEMASSKIKSNELLAPSSGAKPQIIDTQPLLKFRLKRIIASNKEKLRLIEEYKKHMMLIEEAFNQIKEKSSISDLDQITATFIKSEEQNYSLYNYMDSLTQGIDRLQEENREFQEKIRLKIIKDQQKRQILTNSNKETISGSPMKELSDSASGMQSKVKAQSLEEEMRRKEKEHENLAFLINKIKPALESALIELAESPLASPANTKRSDDIKMSLNITDRNIEEYLSELQKHIHVLLVTKQEAQARTITQLKDGVTLYSKPIPSANYEEIIKEKEKVEKIQKDENKFLEHNKFREYAIEFWEKRKQNGLKPVGSNQSMQREGTNSPINSPKDLNPSKSKESKVNNNSKK